MRIDRSKTKHNYEALLSAPRRIGPSFVSGWRQLPLKLRFGLAILTYALQRKKYPKFSLKSLKPMRKDKILAVNRVAVLEEYSYTALMRIPRWPSPAFDHMITRGGLGMDEEAIANRTQIDSAILSITRKCTYECEHCYEYANRADKESISVSKWIEIIAQLQKIGTSVIVLSGGEPMLRFANIVTILRAADKRLSDFHLHTTGIDMSLDRAYELKDTGLVAAGIGLDYPDPERQDKFRGREGAFENAIKAIDILNQVGIFTYTNTCLRKDCIRNGELYEFLELMKKLRVGTIQFLEPKPCGRYGSNGQKEFLTTDEKNKVIDFVKTVNRGKVYKDYPPVSYIAHTERPENFGCLMGGLSHFTIDGAGNVNPCIFVPISFGNILEEDFLEIFYRMKSVITRPYRTQCPSELLNEAIKEQKHHLKKMPVPFTQIKKEWINMLSTK